MQATPETVRRPTITYAVGPCPQGYLLVAATERGICMVSLGDAPADLVQTVTVQFPTAVRAPEDVQLVEWTTSLQAYLLGQRRRLDLPLDLHGTHFQRRVWQALQTIPYGSTRTYSQVAQALGQPTAARAVAGACAANPAALVVPCHRVVRGDGSLGGYRWGIERKAALLALEAAYSA